MLNPRGIHIGHFKHHGWYFFSYWCKICIEIVDESACANMS